MEPERSKILDPKNALEKKILTFPNVPEFCEPL